MKETRAQLVFSSILPVKDTGQRQRWIRWLRVEAQMPGLRQWVLAKGTAKGKGQRPVSLGGHLKPLLFCTLATQVYAFPCLRLSLIYIFSLFSCLYLSSWYEESSAYAQHSEAAIGECSISSLLIHHLPWTSSVLWSCTAVGYWIAIVSSTCSLLAYRPCLWK